jgi:hypothetical protein
MLSDPSAPDAPLRPAVLRAADDRVVAYLEAYAPLSWNGGGSSARFEIVDSSDVAIGQPVIASLHSAGAGRWTISGELAIETLKPGSYEVVATIALEGTPEQRLTRPFAIVR